MLSELNHQLESVNGHRETRLKAAHFIIENPIYFKELIERCFTISDSESFKACWVLEFVAYEKLVWFADYSDYFFKKLKNLTNESSVRPMAKIVQLLIQSHYSKSQTSIVLSENQLQHCIEINFDWLITDKKVATKAYVMRNLYILGKEYDWIFSELKIILEKDYIHHSAAYKAIAREVLKKIK